MFNLAQRLLNRRSTFGGFGVIGLVIACATGSAEEPPGTYGELPAEIQQIQRSLGGPQTNHFQTLSDRAESFSPPTTHRRGIEHQRPEAVFALREAAAQLDLTANRLEQLELYAQADALRQQAQRLRIDARLLLGAATDQLPAVTPTPTLGPDHHSAIQQLWSDAATNPAIAPTRPAVPRPALEPVPQPEIPHDAPKPQPLLDSPEATPKPDVEVEG